MTPLAARKIARVAQPDPYGDVTLAPAAMTGQSESQLARAMVRALGEATPSTAALALSHLRSLFPEAPLTVRVAALNSLMRR